MAAERVISSSKWFAEKPKVPWRPPVVYVPPPEVYPTPMSEEALVEKIE